MVFVLLGIFCNQVGLSQTNPIHNAIQSDITAHFEQIEKQNIRIDTHLPDLTKQCHTDFTLHWKHSPTIGKNTVKLICHNPTLDFYLSVNIYLSKDVIIARRDLQRNQIIQPNDVQLSKKEINSLKLGYFENTEAVVGKLAKRTIKRNQILNPHIINRPMAVKRGDWVTIASHNRLLQVTMKGEALNNGHIGEQILVKNLKTNKKIKAWIVKAGLVSTKATH